MSWIESNVLVFSIHFQRPESNVFSFFNSFSTSVCFFFFELIFWLRLFILSSTSFVVIKFACFSLAATFSAVSLLNSGVVIMISKFQWSLCYNLFFVFTKLHILDVLFSTELNAGFVVKPLILGILFSISVILLL